MVDFDNETEIEEEKDKEKGGKRADLEKKQSMVSSIQSTIVFFIVVLFLSFLLIQFVGQRTTVSGASMENTLSDGDSLIVDKISYRFRNPSRFDIVIFPYKEEKDTYYIKRVIGLPGESVRIDENGVIYINGEILYEGYGLATIINPGIAADTIYLGDDEYFVMGDNRNNSRDSRMEDVGPIHRSDIVGRAWVRIYPFNEVGVLQHARKE